MRYDKASNTHFRRAMYFEAGTQWKLRENNTWGEYWEHPGANSNNVLEGMINEAQGGDDNIVVTESGFYTVVYDGTKLVVKRLSFALRGNALASGWLSDSEPLLLEGAISEVGVNYKYKATLTLNRGEFRFKLASVGRYNGLDYSPPASKTIAQTNFKVSEAGNYEVTLNVTYNAAGDTFTHTFTYNLV